VPNVASLPVIAMLAPLLDMRYRLADGRRAVDAALLLNTILTTIDPSPGSFATVRYRSIFA
jgi:hypothetical protein